MTKKRLPSLARRSRGLTLVELLVAMVIGLIVVLAVTSVVTFGEAQKRTTTSTNDMGQTGAFSSYVLDRAIRSAGSGFAQSGRLGIFGCRLNVSRNGAAILPRANAFPGAFSNFMTGATANLRFAPILIGKSQSSSGSDVLMVMGGNSAAGDMARPLKAPGSLPTNELLLDNTIGFANDDLVLLSAPTIDDCILEQAPVLDAARPDVLPLGSTYYTAAGSYAALRTADPAYVTGMGNAAAGNVQFQLYAVGDNRTLFSYDMLRQSATAASPDPVTSIAEGVIVMRALYGIADPTTGAFTGWFDPGVAPYDIVSLTALSAAAFQDFARSVVAVRVAMVMRGTAYEKVAVSPTALQLFSDLPAAMRQTVTLSGVDDRNYRYRIVDTVVPVRNTLLLPPAP